MNQAESKQESQRATQGTSKATDQACKKLSNPSVELESDQDTGRDFGARRWTLPSLAPIFLPSRPPSRRLHHHDCYFPSSSAAAASLSKFSAWSQLETEKRHLNGDHRTELRSREATDVRWLGRPVGRSRLAVCQQQQCSHRFSM